MRFPYAFVKQKYEEQFPEQFQEQFSEQFQEQFSEQFQELFPVGERKRKICSVEWTMFQKINVRQNSSGTVPRTVPYAEQFRKRFLEQFQEQFLFLRADSNG